jgi:hypothetical protein
MYDDELARVVRELEAEHTRAEGLKLQLIATRNQNEALKREIEVLKRAVVQRFPNHELTLQ